LVPAILMREELARPALGRLERVRLEQARLEQARLERAGSTPFSYASVHPEAPKVLFGHIP
jgi:hypothetical protein